MLPAAPSRLGTRRARAELGQETVDIVNAGSYTVDNKVVSIAEAVALCQQNTQYFPPDAGLPPLPTPHPNLNSKFFFKEQSTLEACRTLAGAGKAPLALNFASALHPGGGGGGFLAGQGAQEESLCRNSALYSSQILPQCAEYYTANKRLKKPLDGLYSDTIIYSPDCPVFRDDPGELLKEFYLVSFITSPAPNMTALKRSTPQNLPLAMVAFKQRAHKVLHLAAALGSGYLVLGAWGCGVFGHNPVFVASTFRDLLIGPFKGRFHEVHFAVLGASNLGPFENHFSNLPALDAQDTREDGEGTP